MMTVPPTRPATGTTIGMNKPKSRHGQIRDALKKEAREQGLAVNDVYNRFFRELFLAELMTRDHGWVLKGGTNLYCRVPGARHTRDLDLYRQDDPTSYHQAAHALVETMDATTIGPYRFAVTAPDMDTVSGTIDSTQLTVTVFYGVGQLLEFHIDVSGDLQVPTVTDTLTVRRSDHLNLTFLGREYTIRSYPIENQIADKVCAMYELHGQLQQPSTRYRDLYDIALIALELKVDATNLTTALRTQEQVRGVTLPDKLHLPGPEWEKGYAGLRKNFPHLRNEITDVHDALQIASALLNPMLSTTDNGTTGTWSPDTGTWT